MINSVKRNRKPSGVLPKLRGGPGPRHLAVIGGYRPINRAPTGEVRGSSLQLAWEARRLMSVVGGASAFWPTLARPEEPDSSGNLFWAPAPHPDTLPPYQNAWAFSMLHGFAGGHCAHPGSTDYGGVLIFLLAWASVSTRAPGWAVTLSTILAIWLTACDGTALVALYRAMVPDLLASGLSPDSSSDPLFTRLRNIQARYRHARMPGHSADGAPSQVSTALPGVQAPPALRRSRGLFVPCRCYLCRQPGGFFKLALRFVAVQP